MDTSLEISARDFPPALSWARSFRVPDSATSATFAAPAPPMLLPPMSSVPPEILERMRKAEDGAAALKEGVKIAQEMLMEVREYVQGVQVSAPFGKIPHALEVFEVL